MGVNVAVIVQVAFSARVAGQVFVWAKSAGFAPVTAMLLIVSAPGPLLVNVTLCGGLVVFTISLPKSKLPEDRLTVGAGPVFISPVATVKKVAGLLWLL
jgi:hypothetical protein